MGIPSLLCVHFCHPFGAGSLLFLSKGLQPLAISFQPFGPVVGRPFRVATPGVYSENCKAEALPYILNRMSLNTPLIHGVPAPFLSPLQGILQHISYIPCSCRNW